MSPTNQYIDPTTFGTFSPTILRQRVLAMSRAGDTVHIACAFSIIEILAVLHRHFLRYPGNDPESPKRDYLILSKGHGVMALYACIVEKGWISPDQLAMYCGDGTHLKGLSDSRVFGLEVTSGSLGHGLSVGVGLAFAAARRGSDQRTFVLVGDGELNEGPIWEAMMFAAHHRLDKLIVVVDANQFQAMGRTDEVLHLGDIADKFRSFGFEVVDVDGHDQIALIETLENLSILDSTRPRAVIAHTIKGKGVPFMENKNDWHYTRLDDDTLAQAMSYLESLEP